MKIIQICKFLLIASFQFCFCDSFSSKISAILYNARAKLPSTFPFSLPWYEQGLEFSCTGCGKCCKVDGDVWLAPEEISSILSFLKMDHDRLGEFRRKYIRGEISPAVEQTSETNKTNGIQSWMCLKRNEGSCVFLNDDGKCSIYDVRPVQCQTYPFWPSVLESGQTWKEESVLPDYIPITNKEMDRHWSAENGGCEGIGVGRLMDLAKQMSHDELKSIDLNQLLLKAESHMNVIVSKKEIDEKRKMAKRHWRRFPIDEIKRSTWFL